DTPTLEDRLDRLGHLGPLTITRPRRTELRPQLGQLQQGALHLLGSRQRIQFGFPRAVIPDQPIPFGADTRLVTEAIPIDDLSRLVPLVVERPPANLAAGDQRAKGPVLGSSPGQYAEESTPALMDRSHGLHSRRLAVGHIEKMRTPRELAQQIPSGLMGPV